MRKVPAFKLGVIALAVAAGMFATELLWRPVFTVRLTDTISLPLWILFTVYGVLQVYVGWQTGKGLALSNAEVAEWGPRLEEATPVILASYEQGTPVRDIAAELETSRGIPKDVTLRYIIALAQHARDGTTPG